MDMCHPYPTTAPTCFHGFETFANGNPFHNNDNIFYKYDINSEPVMKTNSNVYHDLVSSRKYRNEDWKCKFIIDWTDNDTVSWLIEYTVSQGLTLRDVPYYNFKVSGIELRNMRREEVVQRMAHPNVDQNVSIKIGHKIFDTFQDRRIYEEVHRTVSGLRFFQNDANHDILQSAFDANQYSHRNALDCETGDISLLSGVSSKNDSQDAIITSSQSPKKYGNNSKSNDKKDKIKLFKRSPGRPKGSGKSKNQRPRNLSIPGYLWNLLLDNKDRKIIDWEDYSELKFRFIKPDEVAKLWGQMKQNDNMTFEKFSRAMRYHYRQKVLVSVPSARLVYQFGSKGPDFKTQNPNFVKVKSELDLQDMSYS